MKHITITLGAAIAVMCGISSQASVTLINIGGSPPTPGADDVYMLDNVTDFSEAEPAGLNFYSNGGGGGYFPGQIFTTPAGGGFTLNTVTVNFWSGDGGGIGSAQGYTLTICSLVNNGDGTFTASPLASYTSQPFSVVDEDYITFTNLGAALSGSTEYAFAVQNNGSGWIQMAAEDVVTPIPGIDSSMYNGSGNLIDTNDMAVLVPVAGGTIYVADKSPGYQAMFDVGLTPVTLLTVNPPTMTTAGNVYPAGGVNAVSNTTAVTFTSGAVFGGTPPYHYQWQVSYSGGSYANIGIDSTTLTTTPVANGYYTYQVVVTDSTLPTHNTATSSAAVGLTVVPATVTVNMGDEGINNVSAGCYDYISQLTGGGAISSLNYYDNFAAAPAGNIFVTGGNAAGYILNSLQIQTGNNGDTSGQTTTLQPYYLYIYSVVLTPNNTSPTNGVATLVQEYECTSFEFAFGDWIEWEGLSTPLAANSAYAYSFQNNNVGWAGLDASSTAVTSSTVGLACLVSPSDRHVSLNTEGWSGTFQLELTDVGAPPAQCPLANGIVVSPSGIEPAATSITLTENASGATPFTYAWHTDGGSGGALSTSAGTTQSITINTSGSPLTPGQYQYNVTVSNGHGSPSTSATIIVTILAPTEIGVLTDIGTTTPTAGTYDIAQLTIPGGHGSPPGLNYYWNNSSIPGQTFTTGANSLGYVLNYLDIKLAGDSGEWNNGLLPVPAQQYTLTIYSVNTAATNASAIAFYNSQTNFLVVTGSTDQDWISFSGLSTPLAANSVYGWSFQRTGTVNDWCNLGNVAGDLYSGGQAAMFPAVTGSLQYSTTAGYDASFDLGLSLGTVTLNYTVLPDGDLQLCWSTGTLVYTTSLTPPITWTPVPGATSCWTVTPTGPAKYYAVRIP